MPKMPNRVPLGMCQKCRLRGAWDRSDKNWCYWCHTETKENQGGNQSLQRPAKLVSNSRRLSKNNSSSTAVGRDQLCEDEDAKPLSLTKQVAAKRLKPEGYTKYPKSVKGLPHNGAK